MIPIVKAKMTDINKEIVLVFLSVLKLSIRKLFGIKIKQNKLNVVKNALSTKF